MSRSYEQILPNSLRNMNDQTIQNNNKTQQLNQVRDFIAKNKVNSSNYPDSSLYSKQNYPNNNDNRHSLNFSHFASQNFLNQEQPKGQYAINPALRNLESMAQQKKQLNIQENESEKNMRRWLQNMANTNQINNGYNQDVNMVRKEILDIESRQGITPVQQTKKMQYQKLIEERLKIKNKEQVMNDQIKNFTNYYAQSEKSRIERGIINNDFDLQKQERLLDIKLQKEQIDNEKLNFLDKFDQMKSQKEYQIQPELDPQYAKAITGNYNNISFNAIQQKIQQDQEKLQNLKLQNQNAYSQYKIYPDKLEINNQMGINYPQEVQYLLNTNKRALNKDQQINKLQGIRENIEQYGVDQGLKFSNVQVSFQDVGDDQLQQQRQVLQDIDSLRNDYLKFGGQDNIFLNDLNNLENMYVNNKMPQNQQNYQYEDKNSSRQQQRANSMIEYNTQPSTTPRILANSNNRSFTQKPQTMTHKSVQFNPVNNFNELYNKNKTQDEKMLDYLRVQESQVLQNMTVNQHDISLQNQFHQIQDLKKDLENSIIEKNIQQNFSNSINSNNTTSIPMPYSHMSPLNYNQVNQSLNPIQKIMQHQVDPTIYDQREGFVLRFDFMTDIPI